MVITEVQEQQWKFPLDCEPSIDWIFIDMNKKVTCPLHDGMVARLE